MKINLYHRIAAMLLAVMLCVTMLPSAVFAENIPETCDLLDHRPDETGLCVLCGTDVYRLACDLARQIHKDAYCAAMNGVGWCEQHDPQNEAAYEEYSRLLETEMTKAQSALELLDQLATAGVETEETDALQSELLTLYRQGQYYYTHPTNPELFGKTPESDGDELLDSIYRVLYQGEDILPDYPTGYYISDSTGLPVLVGETKTSLSVQTDRPGAVDRAALANGSNTASLPLGSTANVLAQLVYPENGGRYLLELPGETHEGVLEDASCLTMVFPVEVTGDLTAVLHYFSPDGSKTVSSTLTVTVGEYANSAAAGAAAQADWVRGNGHIGMSGYVGSVYLIGTGSGEALYCLDHGLNGRASDCPAYNSAGDIYVLVGDGWTDGARFGTSAQAANQSLIWAGTVASAQALEETLPASELDEQLLFILEHYPESPIAKLLGGAGTLAARDAVSGTLHTPTILGWQRNMSNARLTAIEEDDLVEEDPKYYAQWSAPAQTATGSFDYTYKVNTDKFGLDTKEKVDGAVIEIEPVTKSGSIEGGSWALSPAEKQTVTTSGHTLTDNFHSTGGKASAEWALRYSVSKTSGTRSGTAGPYPSQSEADSAAASARSAAINALKAEAQAAVNAAIAEAKKQLNTLSFTYTETDVPYGFDAYTGENGSEQTIAVTQGTDNDYPMANDEWSMKITIDKVDSETGNRIAGDAEFEVFQWDTVAQMYLPYGGYNAYRIQRQTDGTYKLVNHSSYADTAEKKESFFFTQRNEGKILIVETKTPAGYYGDWSDPDHPGEAGSPCGKRGYFVEVTKERDGTTLALDNADYNADVGVSDEGCTRLRTAEGKVVTVAIGEYKDATRTLTADPTGLANNEDTYTMRPSEGVFQNNRVLGQIVLNKVDLDAMGYLPAGSNGAGTLDGAVYDLYCAEDIRHPDGVSGVVDYSRITDAGGSPIRHTTVLTNSGWNTDYLPILRKDRLVASAEIKDGKLVFAGLYLGNYYVVERATGITLQADRNGKYYNAGNYPELNSKLRPTGSYKPLAKADGKYTDYIYKNRYSGIAEGRALDGPKTYDGYYLSFGEGYLCDEVNHYLAPGYGDESIYINSVEDTSTDEVLKSGFSISKVVSTTGERSPAVKLEGAGFTIFRIDQLSKADSFKRKPNGSYDIQSILDAYRRDSYDQDTLKYDFTHEEQAIAAMYESDIAAVENCNALLTADGDNASGKGAGWQPTGTPNEYRLGEVYSNEDGILRVEGLPYGSWLVVETTIPKDVFQCDPFMVVVDEASPQSRFSVPSGSVTMPSNSYMTFNILNEELEGYLQLTKTDLETGKPVKAANMAFSIYYLDEFGHYQKDKNGSPRLVEMNDPSGGSATAKTTVIYTDENGLLKTPEKLPLGRYRVVELDTCSGFYNEWMDTAFYRPNGELAGNGLYYVDFEVTSDRAYEVIGESADDMDDYIIRESYYNSEALGQITIRKQGEVLTDYANGQFVYQKRNLAGAVFQIIAKEDIPTQDRQGTYWYKAGDIVATVTTGKEGQVDEIAFAPTRTTATYDFLHITHDGTLGEVTVTLPLGGYTVREVTAPHGYTLSDKAYNVTLSWSKQTDDVVLASRIGARQFDVIRAKDATDSQLAEQKLVFSNARVVPVPQPPEDEVTQIGVGIHKRDRETNVPMAGAVYELYTADSIYSVSGEKLADAGQLLAASAPTDTNGFAWFAVDVPIRSEKYGTDPSTNSGNYYLVETVAPAGTLLDSTPIEVSFTYMGQTKLWQVVDGTDTDLRTSVHISKQDITNCVELPGAGLTVSTEDGTIAESWVSSETPHLIRGLELGKVYTLTEVRPAPGYAAAESIRFKLEQSKDENGNLLQSNDVFYLCESGEWMPVDAQTVVMYDEPLPDKPKPSPTLKPKPTPVPDPAPQPAVTPTPAILRLSPQTGDNAPMALLVVILCVCLVLLGILTIVKKKEKRYESDPR